VRVAICVLLFARAASGATPEGHDASALTASSLAAMEAGRLPEAEAGLRELVDLTGARVVTTGERETHATILATLGSVLHLRGHNDEAIVFLRRALAASNPKTDRRASITNGLAAVLLEGGRIDEGRHLASDAVKQWERLHGSSSPELIPGLSTLAEGRMMRAEWAEAEQLLRRADRLAALSGALPAVRAGVAARRGLLWMQMGRYQEAEPVLERALELAEESVGPSHPAMLQICCVLGRCYQVRNRPRDAADMYERYLTIAERSYGADHPLLEPVRARLAATRRLLDARAEPAAAREAR
jgi:tetratricopeptide (TPR) repeat protein